MEPDLASRLREQFAAGSANRPPEVAAAYEAGIERVRRAGVAAASLRVGDRAPAFSLPDPSGRQVTLAGLLETGPAIISFYRGGWCPYCNLELRAYQELLPELAAAGVHLVGVTPEVPDFTSLTVAQHGLDFPVLSDVGSRVARSFGIVHEIAPEVQAIYASKGHDLVGRHGDEGRPSELPLPATFVVDREAVIRFAFASADYTERAEPSEVIDVARDL